MRHLHAHGGGGCTCFIIPPHMLEKIAENGTADQREKARQALSIDHTFRAQRAAQPLQAPDRTQGAGALHKNRRTYTANHGTGLPGTLVRSEGQGAPVATSPSMRLTMGLGRPSICMRRSMDAIRSTTTAWT